MFLQDHVKVAKDPNISSSLFLKVITDLLYYEWEWMRRNPEFIEPSLESRNNLSQQQIADLHRFNGEGPYASHEDRSKNKHELNKAGPGRVWKKQVYKAVTDLGVSDKRRKEVQMRDEKK